MRVTATQRRAVGKLGGEQTAKGASIPVPIEGWDAISPVAAMSPKRAFRLTNWFPQPSWVEVRKGHVKYSNTGTGLPVETVADYQGVSTRELFAASNGKIFNSTIAGTATAVVTGLTNSRFQFINFATTGGNFLYMVNGADAPQYYDGSSWAVAVLTGVTGADIIGVNAHKNRLWYTVTNSSSAWYLPVDQIQGAAVEFPLGGLWNKGGFLMAMATWSVDAGSGPDDYAVFISSRGQVAIYQGTDPSAAATWNLVGVFDMGAPIGRRCFTRAGADVAIICVDGVVPLSKVMIFERAAIPKVALTQNIQRVMNQSARDYMDNFGWELISYPRGTRVILNVPVSENSSQVQYVMNTLNGAWCLFTGMNFNCWALLNDNLFGGGNDGIVYQADRGGSDPTTSIVADMMTSYNYFGDRGKQKRWMMCRPLLTTDQTVAPGLAFNVDFQTNAPISIPQTASIGSSLWDQGVWDVALWSAGVVTQTIWTSVAAIGYCSSIRMVVSIDAQSAGTAAAKWNRGMWGTNTWGNPQVGDITLQVNGFDLTMQQGAFI